MIKPIRCLLTIIFFSVSFISCKKGLFGGDYIEYELSTTSTKGFSIIQYADESGAPTTLDFTTSNSTSKNWKVSVKFKGNKPAMLVLQAFAKDAGSITGSIKVNGKTVKSGTELAFGLLQLQYILN